MRFRAPGTGSGLAARRPRCKRPCEPKYAATRWMENRTSPTRLNRRYPRPSNPWSSGIQGLDDFHPNPSQSRRVPLSSASARSSVSPQFTVQVARHYLVPDDFATIYNLTPLYNSGYDGSGQRIVVAGQSAVDLTDIQDVSRPLRPASERPSIGARSRHRRPWHHRCTQEEADLDIEWAGAIARNANIIYVYSTDVPNLCVLCDRSEPRVGHHSTASACANSKLLKP